ncbi:MAG: hypothetical protein ACYCW6_09365, partial [Candidatus Xenobia bacterium]
MDRTKPAIPDAPVPAETWSHPSNITENHIDQQIYTQLRGLLPVDRFANEMSARRALNNHGMGLFRDGRVQAFYTANQGILMADGANAPQTDPESRHWMGSVTPVRVGNFAELPPLAPVKKAGLFQLGALAHIGHYLLLNSNTTEIRPVAQNVAKELAAITAATKVNDITSAFSGATNYNNDKGGYTDTVKKWDAGVARLDRYVAENYGDEGLWYYALGADSAGIWWLYQGEDQFSGPEYMSMMEMLSAHQPVLVDADPHQEGIDLTPHNRAMSQVVALVNFNSGPYMRTYNQAADNPANVYTYTHD